MENDNFWVTDFTLGRLLLVSLGSDVTEIATGLGQPLDIEFDGRSFLITDFADGFNTPGNGRILHVTQSGEVEILVRDIGNPSGITIQGSDLLFTDIVAGTVNRIEGLLETDLVQTANDIFSIEGVFGRTELQFSLEVNDREPTFVNEIGVFVVDDDQGKGTVNGIAPSQDGYLQEALREAEIIFPGVSDDFLTGGVSTNQLPFSAGDNLVFYLVQNGTTDGFLSGDPTPSVLLALNSENVNGSENLQISESNGTFALAFENELNENEPEFDDLVITFRAVDENDRELIFGTSGDDELEAGVTPDFDGVRDLVFTGAGEELVDLITATSHTRVYSGSDGDELLAGTNNRLFGGDGNDTLDASEGKRGNRLYGGAGDDELFAGTDDRLFGGDDDDTLDASEGKRGNRLYGGAGDDLFFLGKDGRFVGGDGNDRFFASTSGGNTITGGSGADQFWIVDGELPDSANTITDFEPGMDRIGIGGIGASSQADLTFTQNGSSTIISVDRSELAIFLETEISALMDNANFAFI